MKKHLELSDYQLWMCKEIKEKLTDNYRLLNSASHAPINMKEREVISIALSEMMMKLELINRKSKRTQ